MKRLSLVILSSFLLASCGKTSEQKQVESDLNKRVMQMHDSGMVKMRQARELASQIDSAMILSDSLVAGHPKEAAGYSKDDLQAAKKKLAEAQNAMNDWMTKHKPYDAEISHDQAMAQLNGEAQQLTQINAQFDTTLVDVTGTIENHRKFAAELLAKKPAKKGRK